MKALWNLLFGKKLSYILSALWVLLCTHVWAPWIGEPAGEKLKPIWDIQLNEYGQNYLTDSSNPFPSMEIFRYSTASFVTVMTILVLIQTFGKSDSRINRDFERNFLLTTAVLVLSSGWYRLNDYDTSTLVEVFKYVVTGFITAMVSDNDATEMTFILSVTFWFVSIRFLLKTRRKNL
jgi:hypothetical protein